MARFTAPCLVATAAAALLLGLVTAPRAGAATDVKYGLTDDA